MATANIEGFFKLQYERLYDYAHELMRSNPGSTVKVKVGRNGDNVIFNRIYVCFKACKDNFVCCWPIIHLDGCFLKGKYGGELLTAVARDGNDQMCPLAYVVVEVENKDTWTWFLELLIDNLGGGGFCSRCTFMSDQQKGLMQAFQQLLPSVDQRFYVRHLYSNFRKKFPGIILRQLVWKAAATSHPQAWDAVIRQIKDVNEDAFKHLISIAPRFWSRSRFSGRPSCDTIVNNISEAFNSVIVDARGKPIITIWSGLQVFEIRRTSNIAEKYVVDVDKRDCSCRKWLLTGIPCCHALTAVRFLNMNPEYFIPNWFRTTTYEETYNPIIFPVNGPELWQRTSYPDILPPPNRVLPGRPRKNKRLESWEQIRDDTQLGQAGIPKRCGICRQLGHRRTNCPQVSQHQHDQPTTNPTQGSEQQDQQPTQDATQGTQQEDHQPTPHATQGSQITHDDTARPV
ncbi:uncharacterized protein LOC106766211 [Vigna radiata var. radiata]|uniref:Uncharacterized protein LOC106766211 n=1 Tax=Vigna radiata var. radiata TaxID=3916 RepID=A0A1S3UKI3_VIGRR|nr:uncharacterized protein LOC106766211 [Vigna radiata var. radiata]